MNGKEEKKDFVFKITVIGDGGVGKTSLIKKYTQGSFQKQYIKTLGAQFSKYDEKIDGNMVKTLDDYTPVGEAVRSRDIPDWMVMIITDEEYFSALSKLLLQQVLYIRDYASGFIPTI